MLMKLKSATKQCGIGLLELMLSIAIISILLLMATRYYSNTTQGKNIANTISIVSGFIAAQQQYMVLNGQYAVDTDTDKLLTDLNLPLSLDTDPWGGKITIATTTSTSVQFVLPSVPDTTLCTTTLTNMIENNTGAAVGCSSGGMLVIYPAP